ncbi:hypothetical protein [Bailinhaonella thermotolerans]|uniref:hypothetical protein n=1 Tax=Bailinhaonella thermotolerans TaxID=1070861 RepID=UPI00192A44F1|nr:hypothetical protein [Bailinhaonella thermotolerans]
MTRLLGLLVFWLNATLVIFLMSGHALVAVSAGILLTVAVWRLWRPLHVRGDADQR